MRRTYKIAAVAAWLLLGAVLCAAEIPAAKDLPRPSGPLPAEIKIEAALAAIRADPKAHEPLNALAFALAQRARETSDTAHYDRAMEAVETSLRLKPENIEAERRGSGFCWVSTNLWTR